jgi:antitoxin (DNA-binding transcriptional repressor) of toxin-antitoxin stability system
VLLFVHCAGFPQEIGIWSSEPCSHIGLGAKIELHFGIRKSYNQTMPHRISATRAARSFAEILNRVKYRGESFIVERNREPMCRIEPVRRRRPLTTDNFAEFWKSLPRPDDKFADDLEEIHNLFRKLPPAAWER